MKTNHEYFQKHFAAIELLVQKELMLEKLWSVDDTGSLTKAHYQVQRDTKALNELILNEEANLREQVVAAEKEGAVFVFETFAKKHLLTPFERRAVLFFIYLDLYRTGVVVYHRRPLGAILDIEDSPTSRGNVLLNLIPKSRLFRKKILSEAEDDAVAVRMAVSMRDQLRGLVAGRKVGRLRKDNGDDKEDNCEVVIGQVQKPEFVLEDAVIAPEKLQEILLHVDNHSKMLQLGVMKGKRGRGLGMLFYGPPGVGKTMLAHALATRLRKKILQVNVSQTLSKWVGQAEKNIVGLFKLAKDKDCVLVLDECDSLVGSRSGDKPSWQISQVNVLLEQLENFNGIYIFTTNRELSLDPAMERRVSLRVHLDLPTADARETIWRKHVPSSIKVSSDIDWTHIGNKYNFSGGYIKNAVLSSIRRMLSRGGDSLSMKDLVEAAEGETKSLTTGKAKGPLGFSVNN